MSKNLDPKIKSKWGIGRKILLLMAIILALFILIYGKVWNVLSNLVSPFFTERAPFASTVSGLIVFIICIICVPYILKLLGKASLGKSDTLGLSLMITAAVVLFIYSYLTRGEFFAEGKDKEYICLAGLTGAEPRITGNDKNIQTGHKCVEIVPGNSNIAHAIVNNKVEPKPIQLTTSLEAKNLRLRKHGNIIIFKSKRFDKDGLPILYEGPWFDDYEEGLTIPATQIDVDAWYNFLLKRESEAKAKLEEEEALKKAEEEKQQLIRLEKLKKEAAEFNKAQREKILEMAKQ